MNLTPKTTDTGEAEQSVKPAKKPLSEITDQDAIEVTKIHRGITNDAWDNGRWIENGREIMIRKTLHAINYGHPICFPTAIRIYQYLQSRGYDLPVYYPVESVPVKPAKKPLSEITDQDLIEVCCSEEKCLDRFEVVRINRYDTAASVDFKWIDQAVNRNSYYHSSNGISFNPEHLTVKQYQYLAYRNYDLPQYYPVESVSQTDSETMNFLDVLEENYQATFSPYADEIINKKTALEAVQETYRDLIAIYKAKFNIKITKA